MSIIANQEVEVKIYTETIQRLENKQIVNVWAHKDKPLILYELSRKGP